MSAECDFASGRLQQAASADTAAPESLYWRTIALRELAQRAYDRLFELPPSRERFEAAAEAHEAAGRYREAAAAWKDALAQAPGDHELQRRQALALCHSNDCVAALPLLQGLLAATPTSAELNYLCGLALTSTRDPAKALPLLEAAVRLDPKFLPARGALGEALLEAGQAERAIPHLEAAAASDDSGVRRYQFARALQAAGQREQASQQFKLYREMLDRRTAAEKDEPRITAP
jgi:predicted Zn-dependent protease